MRSMIDFFSPSVTTSKPNRLKTLSDLSDKQAAALQAAYTADGRTGVVKTTTSQLNSQTSSTGLTPGVTTPWNIGQRWCQ